MENPKLTEFTTFKLSMNVLTIFSRYNSISFPLFQRVMTESRRFSRLVLSLY